EAEVQADSTFVFPDSAEFQGVIWCHLLPDGRFLAGGNKALRLKSDGSLDSTFPVLTIPGGGFLRKPVLEPGGGFTAFGTYSDPIGAPLRPIGRRYGPDGIVDDTFQPAFEEHSDPVLAQRDSNGRYLVSGFRLPGVESAGLIRFNSNGSLDS